MNLIICFKGFLDVIKCELLGIPQLSSEIKFACISSDAICYSICL